jgi:DHA2 family methylenomycin A resistance protein-like MFS transporter
VTPDLESERAETATLVAASLGFAVIQLDVFVVNVAVHEIGDSLGGGTAGLQWVVGAYTLAFAATILTAGALGDRFGARRMYCLGFLVFLAASVACGAAPTLVVLVAARAVQGLGAALLGACSLSLVNHTFHDPKRRAHAVGLWAAGASVALSAGPVVGGLLIAAAGWRTIFFINVPIGLVALYLTRRYTDETPYGEHRIDVAGQVAAIVGMTALAGGLIEGGSAGFGDPAIVATLAVAAVALAGFVAIEARVREPMLPLPLFRHRPFAAPAVLGFVINVAFYGLIFVFSLFFQRVQGDSALRTGLLFVPMTAAVLVTNVLSGRIAAAIGARATILIGLVSAGLGCAGLLTVESSTSFGALVVQQVLLGGGLGLVVPPMTNALMGAIDRSRSGVASGTLSTTRQSGSVLGVAIFGSLIASRTHFVAGFHAALAISLVLVGVAIVLSRAIEDPER